MTLAEAQVYYADIAKDLKLGKHSSLGLRGLFYHGSGTTKASEKKEWLKYIKHELDQYDYLLIADADYFKILTKQTKADTNLGLVFTSEYTTAKVVYIPTHVQARYDFNKFKSKAQAALLAIISDISGSYVEIGSDIIHSEYYPQTIDEIKTALEQLKTYPELAVDIEAKSLKVTEAGIYTIAFAWDEHNGIAFAVDAHTEPRKIRELLREFFDFYKGKLVVHKANYDIPVLVYNLYMEEDFTQLLNQVNGINVLCNNLDDTLLITYLATNSCSGNTLGLKELAQPFAGNWAVDVSDVTKVDLQELLRYNLIDCLSTVYVKKQFYPLMVQDNQEEIYKEHFLPYLKDCIRMQLNGLPIKLNQVNKLEEDLLKEKETILSSLANSPAIKLAEYRIAEKLAIKKNSIYKKKRVTPEEVSQPFNFSSNQQLEVLLYEVMGLPVIEKTKKGNPSTSGSVLKQLTNHTNNQQYKDTLLAISQYNDVEKILTSFIPAFKNCTVDSKGNARLSGYFNLGGTVSGRMSSNSPNLQNIPATGSRFSKPVKECFGGNDEWVMCGIDFNALEDRIDALKTGDSQKLKVYLEGYDGHCLRAYAYFGDQMPDIVPDSVSSINSIAKLYKELRQDSKPPSFALTYGGTYLTLMKNCGFSEELAKKIEERYHTLYVESDNWVRARIIEACQNGYITGAFGLRVRTPMLKGASIHKFDRLQAAESRTAGNALGQGWGLLNNRAMNAVLKRVDEAGLTDSIYPIAAIHDAAYYMVRNDASLITWFNKVVTEEAKWQDHPVIYHPQVGLEGQLDLFIPNWANPLTLPESLNQEELIQLCINHIKEKQ